MPRRTSSRALSPGSGRRQGAAAGLCALLLLLAPAAAAQDHWTAIRPGVDLLHRMAPGPQEIWAARVDLSVPLVGLHVSADVASERGVDTLRFARSVDALVAINGDWSDGRTPVGLTISDGRQWHDHIRTPDVGARWGFVGCTADKRCTIGWERPLQEAWWFAMPTLRPHRFFQALGANGLPLIEGGARAQGCYDPARHPRSAAGLDAAGVTLWLVVVDGRRPGAVGMTCDEVRDLMADLGCHDAAMLDGGGSSTLVVDGSVRNTPSDGSPRVVANHLAVIYGDALDARCRVASGRFCDGSRLATCQGGRYLGDGDCAAYGASCEEDGAYAYCVDWRCPEGRGQGADCADDTTLRSCNDGQYGEGDCAAFGLVCGADDSGAACMDARCQAGPRSAFCTAAGLLAACNDGSYSEAPCGAGHRCEDGTCVDDSPPQRDAGVPDLGPGDLGPSDPAAEDAGSGQEEDGGAAPADLDAAGRGDTGPWGRDGASPPPDASGQPTEVAPDLGGRPPHAASDGAAEQRTDISGVGCAAAARRRYPARSTLWSLLGQVLLRRAPARAPTGPQQPAHPHP